MTDWEDPGAPPIEPAWLFILTLLVTWVMYMVVFYVF
jgi:hypothetical protein